MSSQTTHIRTNWLRQLTRQPVPEHSGIYKLHLLTQGTVGSGDVHASVELPEGVEENQWIASKLLALNDEVVNLVNLLLNMCSNVTCPRMTAGKHASYSWADETHPVPQPLSAPEYMRTLAVYAEERLSDRSLLPVDGSPLPPRFLDFAKTLCKRFFRVYAHAYLSHFQGIRDCGAEGTLNSNYKHFLFFVMEFHLVSSQDMYPLSQLSDRFLSYEAPKKPLENADAEESRKEPKEEEVQGAAQPPGGR